MFKLLCCARLSHIMRVQ
uniref:Uncharacterized protein n=1 Tax=Anguilla anguilla TaxID=7936 RepID=A0A0E9RWE8_ANGAN